MGSHTILKMQMESCRKRVAELEEEVRKLRGQLLAIRDWLEEVESQHAVLSLRMYELRLEVERGE